MAEASEKDYCYSADRYWLQPLPFSPLSLGWLCLLPFFWVIGLQVALLTPFFSSTTTLGRDQGSLFRESRFATDFSKSTQCILSVLAEWPF
jgi:hypothetical protein